MVSTFLFRSLVLVAALAPLGACESFFGDDNSSSIGARRFQSTAAVTSSQRLDDNGYPLLGAYPKAAAPQLTDAEVKTLHERLNSSADERSSGASRSTNADELKRLEALRQKQKAEVRAAMTATPSSKKSRPETPEEVLRQIRNPKN